MNDLDEVLGDEIEKINLEDRNNEIEDNYRYDDWEEEYMKAAYLEDYGK
jgi:hypothetical protein